MKRAIALASSSFRYSSCTQLAYLQSVAILPQLSHIGNCSEEPARIIVIKCATRGKTFVRLSTVSDHLKDALDLKDTIEEIDNGHLIVSKHDNKAAPLTCSL